MTVDPLLDAPQAAQVLRTSVANFIRLRESGLGPRGVTIDGVEFYRKATLDQYIVAHKRRGVRLAVA